MKRRVGAVLFVMLAVFLIGVVPVSAAAKKNYVNITSEIETKTLSATKVKVKWGKHKADKFIIYKSKFNKKGYLRHRKLKTVSGKKTSAVIKAGKNEYLYLWVKGIRKKTNTVYTGDAVCWSGIATPAWDDYAYAESGCSPTYIELDVLGGGGLKPDGYKVYRKAKGARSYKLIKKIKRKSYQLLWKDKTVKTGKAYYYKVSSYRKIGKKVLHSKKSESILRYAVNYNGKYKVSTSQESAEQVSSEQNENQMTITLTSDSKNGESVFTMYDLYYGMLFLEDPSAKDQLLRYKIKEYSLDGETWKEVKETSDKIKLKAGKTIYFRLSGEQVDQEQVDFDYYTLGAIELSYSYRGVPSFLNVPAATGEISSYQDSESIH